VSTAYASPAQRATEPTGGLIGIPIVFDQPTRISTPHGPFDEVIAPGAATKVLRLPEIALLRDHNPSLVLARVGSGTLTLTDDALGVRMAARVAETPLGAETFELVRRGDLSGMSFSFVVGSDEWRAQAATTVPLRVIVDIETLWDVSVVTYPAYPTTTVSIDGRAQRYRHTQRRLLEQRHFGHGGLVRYGPRITPPRDLAVWARSRPIRRGRQALATR